MSGIAILPGLVAMWWISRHSYREAYLHVYLFSLFLLPGWTRFPIPALPDPTFHEAALIPIACAFFMKPRAKWRFSAIDVLVLLLATHIGISEYINAGFKEAQNLMFDMVAGAVLPYVLAKGIIEPNGMRVEFVKKIVGMLAILTVMFVYEARFGNNPYRMVFDRFFPGQGDGWVTTFRHGLARTAGPFGHAILAGIVVLIGFCLARWLEKSGYWEPRFQRWHPISWSKARIMSVTMILGLFLTMVRGPQIGALIALAFTKVGAGKHPIKNAILLIVMVGIPAASAGYSYVSVGRAGAKTEDQETAAYRKELIDKYQRIAMDHSLIGWGRNGWPKVPGMPSIDNYYLLLALMHGFTATVLMMTILVMLVFQLLRNGLKAGPAKPKGSSLSFTLAGMFLGIMFSILTVYMGDSVIPIFFTMVGFADGYLRAGGDLQKRTAGTAALEIVPAPRFATVLA